MFATDAADVPRSPGDRLLRAIFIALFAGLACGLALGTWLLLAA